MEPKTKFRIEVFVCIAAFILLLGLQTNYSEPVVTMVPATLSVDYTPPQAPLKVLPNPSVSFGDTERAAKQNKKELIREEDKSNYFPEYWVYKVAWSGGGIQRKIWDNTTFERIDGTYPANVTLTTQKVQYLVFGIEVWQSKEQTVSDITFG